MKLNENLFSELFFLGLIGSLILLASSDVIEQANLQKAVAKRINKVSKDASEVKESRKIVYGDGLKDAVVQHLIEGFDGGNSWGQSIAVFLNKKSVYKMAADETVGGKFFRSFDLLKVARKEIIGATETCPRDTPQGLCKNPIKKQAKYVLLNGKLKEK